ncbi:MAG: hypothetical protein JW974_02310 [Alphaproteobacteria bacterium]|nr:hypothetical protein [Alphaproteobacteria bacterium]MBN2674950.1 hypothetical protein [Alphaproteobacteria bacterium]
MQNKIKKLKFGFLLFAVLGTIFCIPAMAEDDSWADEMSANAIKEYNVDGSVFQKITNLEEEKVLMQLEKERAQLDLELDRLAAEKIKLHMEIDTLSSNSEEQKKLLEDQKAQLAAEAARLEQERKLIVSQNGNSVSSVDRTTVSNTQKSEEKSIEEKYKLIDIIGASNQLQATLEDLESGQRKKISVGKVLDGYTIKSISLDDGVSFLKDDVLETLNVGKDK